MTETVKRVECFLETMDEIGSGAYQEPSNPEQHGLGHRKQRWQGKAVLARRAPLTHTFGKAKQTKTPLL